MVRTRRHQRCRNTWAAGRSCRSHTVHHDTGRSDCPPPSWGTWRSAAGTARSSRRLSWHSWPPKVSIDLSGQIERDCPQLTKYKILHVSDEFCQKSFRLGSRLFSRISQVLINDNTAILAVYLLIMPCQISAEQLIFCPISCVYQVWIHKVEQLLPFFLPNTIILQCVQRIRLLFFYLMVRPCLDSFLKKLFCLGLDDKHPASCWAKEVIHPGQPNIQPRLILVEAAQQLDPEPLRLF